MKSRTALIKTTPLLVAASILSLLDFSASATPFASGVTNNNGTIQFTLNETADFDGVSVVFDNGATTNVLAGGTNAGLQTFLLGAHTNFAIYVTKLGAGGITQISADTNYLCHWNSPRGVASIYNPTVSSLFGRLFVDNSAVGGVQ